MRDWTVGDKIGAKISIITQGFKHAQNQLIYNFWRMQNLQKELEHAFSYCEQRDNQSIKTGEAMLAKLRALTDYPMLLLTYMKNADTNVGKLRAAIQLRIWCQNYKNMEQFERDAYSRCIEDIKETILYAFLSFTDKIQQTLLPGIVALAQVQFPNNWSSLVQGLIVYSTQNPGSTLKILQLMSQITNKYSYLTRSDELYNQIIHVCDHFHNYLLDLTRYSIENILKNQNNPDQLKILQNQMILFYNLNYQDLHPNFQSNLKQWMEVLNRVMRLPDTQNFFKCKGAALQSILLYASKYKEDVEESIKGFSQQIWALCADASPDPQYDDIVFNSLKYFRSLIMWQDMREFFANNIQNLICNLILPNLAFNASYKQLFNQDIQTFLSYFFRNAQINSRRAAAIELLQSIVRNYKNFEQFIENQVRGFTPGPDNVDGHCLLLSLVIESAAKGFRDVDGVTQLQINQQIITYCYENLVKNTLNIIYEICNNNSGKPIEKQINLVLLITTLRFIFYFRIFLPPEQLNLILQLCCGIHTESDSLKQVLLLLVNSLVTLKHGNFSLYKNLVYYYDQQRLKVVAGNILGMIGRYDQYDNSLNGSVNKLLYSTIKQLKQSNEEFYGMQTGNIIKSMLGKTKNYTFNSVLPLFEALGYLTYYLCLIKSKSCQDLQFVTKQYFHEMMNSQSDILNFCFQLLSIFLQYNPGDISFYQDVYNSIIAPNNWCQENLSIMSSYLQYITAFIALNNNRITIDKQAYQKILTKLIQLQHFQLFFRLLRRILKLTDLQGFYKSGYMNVLIQGTRYISSKSLEGRKLSLLFIFQITFEYDITQMINCFNSVQPGFYQNLLIDNKDIIQTIQAFRSRKMMFGSICNALVTRSFSNIQNQALLLNLLIENITGRFKRDNLLLGTNENAQKLESTYQKLAVFKEIENIDTSISLDEESILVQAYTYCYNNNHNITNLISEKNLERIKKLYDKQQSKGNN